MQSLDLQDLIKTAIKAGNQDMVSSLLEKAEKEKTEFLDKQKEFRQEASEFLNNLDTVRRDMMVDSEKLDYSYASMEEVMEKIRAAMEGLHLWYHLETSVDPDRGFTFASLILSHENGYSECWARIAMPFTDNPIRAHGVEASLTYARKAALLSGFNLITKDDDAVAQDGVTNIKVNPQRKEKARSDAEQAVEELGLAQQMKFEPTMQMVCRQIGLPTDSNRANFSAANWEAIEDRAKKLANAQTNFDI